MLKVMKDMMDVVKEKKKKHLEEIYENTEIAWMEANTDFVPCLNPMCDCGTLYMLSELDGEEYALPLNVHDQRIMDYDEVPLDIIDNETQEYARTTFLETVKEDGWLLLQRIYLEKKNIIIDEVNPAKIQYEFEDEDILDNETLVSYDDIFPCAHFPVILGESVYIVFEHYCKDDICNCKAMLFSIQKATDEGFETLGNYAYNYSTQQGSLVDVEAENKIIIQKVIDTLFLEYPDIDKTLGKRNTVVRKLFRKAKKKHWATQGRTRKNTVRISRNAPCPCGSGKKYKRCCGRN